MNKLTKKLNHHSELMAGSIYNSVYVGDNKAYARINGKNTFLVLSTFPEFTYVDMFSQFGMPFEEDLRSGVVTVKDLDAAFKDCELYKPTSEAEWFKKSVVAASLKQAIADGLVKIGDAKRYADGRGGCPFCYHSDGAPHYGLRGHLYAVLCGRSNPQPASASIGIYYLEDVGRSRCRLQINWYRTRSDLVPLGPS